MKILLLLVISLFGLNANADYTLGGNVTEIPKGIFNIEDPTMNLDGISYYFRGPSTNNVGSDGNLLCEMYGYKKMTGNKIIRQTVFNEDLYSVEATRSGTNFASHSGRWTDFFRFRWLYCSN